MKKVALVLAGLVCSASICAAESADKDKITHADELPKALSAPVQWRVGAEISGAYVIPTSDFAKGNNIYGEKVSGTFTGSLRGDFSFNPESRAGRLYHGLYQGLGVDVRTFFRPELLGTPVSVYIFQGAPVKHFSKKVWLGYEWRFGAAFGWKDRSRDLWDYGFTPAISTRVTAHMAVSLKLNYEIDPHWQMSVGIDATHFSNGNTSFPNAGINTGGVSVGVAYVINPQSREYEPSPEEKAVADRKHWEWDILAYGSWRKREVVLIPGEAEPLLPGSYGVAGIQGSYLRRVNRYFCFGPALDIKYDGSAGKIPYWIGESNEDLRFGKVPFLKKCSVGAGAMAEFTMPIFTVGAGLGYNVLAPYADKRFYQILYIKAYLTRNLYLNAGYRLGNFKTPQHLMLGAGVRF